MNAELLLQIIYNSTVLLTISLIHEMTFRQSKKSTQQLMISGMILGLIGLVIMSIPFRLSDGIFFDTRSILMGLSGAYFGGLTTVIAGLILSFYRLSLGGTAMIAGTANILISGALGLLWRRFCKQHANTYQTNFNWKNAYLFGLLLHLAMLLTMLLMPFSTAVEVLKVISGPVLLIYPVTTVLLSKLIFDQEQRRSSLNQIKEAEEKYKSLFNNYHTVMLIIDPDSGRIIDANPAAESYYGWPAETLKAMKISDINLLTQAEIEKEMEKARKFNRNCFQFKHRKANGDVSDVEVYSGPIRFMGKTHLYSIVHDIQNRIQAEVALKESVERFRLLVESSPDAIFIQTHGRFTYANDAMLRLMGAKSPDDLIGRSVLDLIHPEERAALKARIDLLNLHKQPVPMHEETFLRLDGHLSWAEVVSVPVRYNETQGAIVFARDITERKAIEAKRMEMESQLRQQQKLEAIGTLAGGVAHEINNPINGIMNYAQLIIEEMETVSLPSEYAKEILHEANRISEIVRNLLQFSRHEKQSHSSASIYDIIHHTTALVRTIIRKDQIHLKIQIPEGLPEIKCRSQQIQQVLMNLLTNARDALNEKYPGYHDDKVMILSCSQLYQEGHRWLSLAVEDHGNGIPPEVQSKIFEPFFSTKPRESGTGLGLSISYGIVKEHHGDLSFDTEPGKMTRFVLNLPVDNGWDYDREEPGYE